MAETHPENTEAPSSDVQKTPRKRGRPIGAKTQKRRDFFRGAELQVNKDEADAQFDEIHEPKKRLYLSALTLYGPRYGAAAKAAGVCATTGYLWRRDLSDVEFQNALHRAIKIGIERCESELWRRGISGVEKPVYQGGRLVGTVREYDTTAAIFMLKGAEPEKYRENYRHEHTGPGGGAVRTEAAVVLATLSTEELQQKLSALQQSLALPAGMTLDVSPTADAEQTQTPEQRYQQTLDARRTES